MTPERKNQMGCLANLHKQVSSDWIFELLAEVDAAEKENERLKGAIKKASNELGVPQPGYPAPVANAAKILRVALSGKPEKFKMCLVCNSKVERPYFLNGASYGTKCKECGTRLVNVMNGEALEEREGKV